MLGRYKGLLIILDGLGDRPQHILGGLTPLEAAHTPVLDQFAEHGCSGMVDPLVPGVPVGTHTGTGVLLGLAPRTALRLRRGPVEAAGAGMPLQPGEVALRCNFATLKTIPEGLEIVDRRAGRIRERTDELAQALQAVPLGGGITASLRPATQHRAVLRLSGPGLSPAISDTDPGSDNKTGNPMVVQTSHALSSDDIGARRTADALNQFVRVAFEALEPHAVNAERVAQGLLPATGIITRGAGCLRNIHSTLSHLGLNSAVVAGERTVLGLGRMLSQTVITSPRFTSLCDTDLAGKVEAAVNALDEHDLVFLHIKGPDICAHDRDPIMKRTFLERIDSALAPLLNLELVLGVSGDHSTDCNTGRHCGDPVPSILCAPTGRKDRCTAYSEESAMNGGLGRISGATFLLSLLDTMGWVGNFRPADRTFYCLE